MEIVPDLLQILRFFQKEQHRIATMLFLNLVLFTVTVGVTVSAVSSSVPGPVIAAIPVAAIAAVAPVIPVPAPVPVATTIPVAAAIPVSPTVPVITAVPVAAVTAVIPVTSTIDSISTHMISLLLN